jgi:hypothetical protein
VVGPWFQETLIEGLSALLSFLVVWGLIAPGFKLATAGAAIIMNECGERPRREPQDRVLSMVSVPPLPLLGDR